MRYLFHLGLALLTTGLLRSTARADEPDIRKAVTFYASFDEAVKGDFGAGDLNAGTRFPHPTEKGQFVFEKGIDANVLKVAQGKVSPAGLSRRPRSRSIGKCVRCAKRTGRCRPG